ncbi:MAG: hypothetical protein KJ058_03300 [Thermoanaerobaculia bacterium]|nr:hypothetical protein [Thermoanaerobaculia bacterium]
MPLARPLPSCCHAARPGRIGRLGWTLGGCLALLAVGLAEAQAQGFPPPGPPRALSSYTLTLRHQPTEEALALVRPLLSPSGSVEVAVDGRTLVVRDELASLGRIAAALRGFDHPAAPVRLSVRLVWAGPQPVGLGAAASAPLDGELALRLRRLLRYETFTLLSETRLEANEGDEVSYEFRSGYRVRFRLGTLLPGQRLRLHGFRVTRAAPDRSDTDLIHTTVNLPLAQPMILGLTRDEGSASALLVVLSYEPRRGG